MRDSDVVDNRSMSVLALPQPMRACLRRNATDVVVSDLAELPADR
jgi:hypothetical protein